MASGEIFFNIVDTITSPGNGSSGSRQVNGLNDRVYVGRNSSLSVSGDIIDETLVETVGAVYIDGGVIKISDGTKDGMETILMAGSVLDVSGGYVLDEDEDAEAGGAGSIKLKSDTLIVESDLRGYSLIGEDGGSITLHASTITVAEESTALPEAFGASDALPDAFMDNGFVLDDDYLNDSGFSEITLLSFNDLIFEEGVTLSPSTVKLNYPTYGAGEAVTLNGTSDLVSIAMAYLTSSSITAQAAQAVTGRQEVDSSQDTYTTILSPGASLEVSPGGAIALAGLSVDIYGSLTAPAGTVSISATGSGTENGILTLHGGSAIDASGYNLLEEETTVAGIGGIYDTLDGGTVTLAAAEGTVVVADGSAIDISGSLPVQSLYYKDDGVTVSPKTKTVASNAGSLVLEYEDGLTLAGDIDGHAYRDSTHGASLSIIGNQNAAMTINATDIDGYLASGFDSLALSSLVSLIFTGNIDAEFGLGLTLDAPLISASGINHQTVSLSATTVTLANTHGKYGDTDYYSHANLVGDGGTLDTGDASFFLGGNDIDITGSVAVSGFDSVTVAAAEDIRLTDEGYYDNQGYVAYSGMIRTPGDLTLQATRIYTTTNSSFTLASDAGRLTILPGSGDTGNPIVSAGGTLTLAAEEIDHQGYLAAPMGSIVFRGSLQDEDDDVETVFLADGSVTTVSGDSQVHYGILDDIYWTLDEKPTELTDPSTIVSETVSEAPEASVEFNGNTVVMQDGALVDTSGGGSVFAYEFVPGTDGLVDRLTNENTYVIVPGVYAGATAIRISEGSGLPAGTYSLLPAEYAFLDGAYVVTYIGSANTANGVSNTTAEGYSVVTGYETLIGTEYVSSEAGLYSVRSAAAVLAEGEYNTEQIIAGDGGSVSIEATTSILDGTFNSSALDGYSGGTFAISGAQSAVVRSTSTLGTGYRFDDIQGIIGEYADTAQILDTTLTDSDAYQLNIGSLDITATVTVESGAVLEAPIITLAANEQITLESDGLISAQAAIFNTPEGSLTVEADAEVEAGERMDIIAHDMNIDGRIGSDGGTLSLTADEIVVADDNYAGEAIDALVLSESLGGFDGFDDLELNAIEVAMLGDLSLTVTDTLIMDASAITSRSLEGAASAVVSASRIQLLNTGSDAYGGSLDDTGTLTLTAAEDIVIGHGDVQLDGFDSVAVTAGGDVAFSGDGSLVSSGDLTFSAARLTATYYENDAGDYESAQFSVRAGSEADGYRNVTIRSSGGNSGATVSAGGTLDILGDAIIMDDGAIEMNGGWVTLAAAGSEGIVLEGESRIDATGSEYAAGGQVILTAESGDITMASASTIDVSAGEQGDAGTLTLEATKGIIDLGGTILGQANGGSGGGFSMDTGTMQDTSDLIAALTAGGFDETVYLRTRGGDIAVAAADTLIAHEVTLTADGGAVTLAGTIDASGEAGGEVAVNADAILLTGLIDASADGDDGQGGRVSLNAVGDDASALTLDGAVIDVSGGSEEEGGSVYFRAMQRDTDDDEINDAVNMSLDGTVIGAASVTAEGFWRYDASDDGQISTADIVTYHADADAFLDNIDTDVLSGGLTLTGGNAEGMKVVPGIEVTSSGDLTLAAEWDLTERGKSAQAGTITLRAAGNLTLNASIVDHPDTTSNIAALGDTTELSDSWGNHPRRRRRFGQRRRPGHGSHGRPDLFRRPGGLHGKQRYPFFFRWGHGHRKGARLQ